MTSNEFDKVWRLLGSLFPSAAAKKSQVDIAVWRRGLSVYGMEEVSDRIMDYAREHKFFPDLADVTAGLTVPTVNEGNEELEAAAIANAKVYAIVRGLRVPDFQTGREAYDWFRGQEALA